MRALAQVRRRHSPADATRHGLSGSRLHGPRRSHASTHARGRQAHAHPGPTEIERPAVGTLVCGGTGARPHTARRRPVRTAPDRRRRQRLSCPGLPPATRSRFEASLGGSLAEVRLHDGPASATAAAHLDARAFANGHDIHFAAGAYAPGTPDGDHLLAHEVAHTRQHDGASGLHRAATVGPSDDPAEHEADVAADAMLVGAPALIATPATATIARSPTRAAPTAPGARGDTGARAWRDGQLIRVAPARLSPAQASAAFAAADLAPAKPITREALRTYERLTEPTPPAADLARAVEALPHYALPALVTLQRDHRRVVNLASVLGVDLASPIEDAEQTAVAGAVRGHRQGAGDISQTAGVTLEADLAVMAVRDQEAGLGDELAGADHAYDRLVSHRKIADVGRERAEAEGAVRRAERARDKDAGAIANLFSSVGKSIKGLAKWTSKPEEAVGELVEAAGGLFAWFTREHDAPQIASARAELVSIQRALQTATDDEAYAELTAAADHVGRTIDRLAALARQVSAAKKLRAQSYATLGKRLANGTDPRLGGKNRIEGLITQIPMLEEWLARAGHIETSPLRTLPELESLIAYGRSHGNDYEAYGRWALATLPWLADSIDALRGHYARRLREATSLAQQTRALGARDDDD
ncbi:MAG: DUF4157 domain-containing protein [Myxococcales bacterium]|nr:DUF4157 domain-containing protein [Myxococcales bacterium]